MSSVAAVHEHPHNPSDRLRPAALQVFLDDDIVKSKHLHLHDRLSGTASLLSEKLSRIRKLSDVLQHWHIHIRSNRFVINIGVRAPYWRVGMPFTIFQFHPD